jgi:hypothetical protein
MRARADLGAASVTITGGVGGSVSVDVAQFTRAVSGILQRLEPQGTALFLEVAGSERGGRSGVEIALQSQAKPSPRATGYGKPELEWALARRIVALHGGEVQERACSRGRTMVLFMPADT